MRMILVNNPRPRGQLSLRGQLPPQPLHHGQRGNPASGGPGFSGAADQPSARGPARTHGRPTREGGRHRSPQQ